jgi:ABC-type polysaccharide/polyol phosphate export permease
MVSNTAPKPFEDTQIYDSSKHNFRPLLEIKEAWRYRDLVFFLVQRDITTRYKRSALGIAWTMLNPLGMMIILAIVFSEVFRITIEGYPAYVLSALIAWTFFSQTSSNTIATLVWGGDLLQRIYIPRSTFAISAIGTGLVNLILSMVPLVLVNLFIGIPLHATLLLSPLVMIFLAMFSLGIGLLISTIGIYFADVVEMYQIVLSAWFYITPIIYPLDVLPQNIQVWLRFNPTVHLINLFRDLVFVGTIPPIQNWLLCLLISSTTLLLGWLVFTGKADEFAYRT